MAKGLYATLLSHLGQAIDPYEDAIEDDHEIRTAIDELVECGYAEGGGWSAAIRPSLGRRWWVNQGSFLACRESRGYSRALEDTFECLRSRS